jgi:hypothetical protein
MALLLIGACLCGLPACSQGSSDGEAVAGEVESQTETSENESGRQQGGAPLPIDWPADVPVYPSGIVTSSGTGPKGSVVHVATSDSAATVAVWYQLEMEKRGWESVVQGNLEGVSHGSFTKDGRTARIGADEYTGAEETAVVISHHPPKE